MRSHGEFNAWNARKLAERPSSQTVERSLEQMRASRAAIRRVVAGLSDAELERPVWISLAAFGGWRTIRFALELARMHSWAHIMQFRMRLKRTAPLSSPAVTHGALNGFVRSFPALLNHKQAAHMNFTVVMQFTGAGGGSWTIRVAHSGCTVMEGQAAQADVVIAQSPETFAQLLAAMRHPLPAFLRGQIRVRGLSQVGTLLKLFPVPKPDQPIEPVL